MTEEIVEGDTKWLFAANISAWGSLSTISMSRTSNISVIARSMIFICKPARNAAEGEPTSDEALRVIGNLCTPDGKLAPPELVKQVGIGTRVRIVFSDVAPGLSLPQWVIDESAQQPANVWRYPQE
jgi:hypothetical protein